LEYAQNARETRINWEEHNFDRRVVTEVLE
jgi:hypothetical protein